MADIFISYSNSDRPKAKALAEAIQQQGWSVWWDRKIPFGKSFDQVIEQELDTARCVLVVWTKASVASDWVKTEAAEGARRHVLLPVFMDEAKIPLEFRRLQAANLTDWQPGSLDSEFEQLLIYIGEMLGESTKDTSVQKVRDIVTEQDNSTVLEANVPTDTRQTTKPPERSWAGLPVIRNRLLILVGVATLLILLMNIAVRLSSHTPYDRPKEDSVASPVTKRQPELEVAPTLPSEEELKAMNQQEFAKFRERLDKQNLDAKRRIQEIGR
jgi:TIR domain